MNITELAVKPQLVKVTLDDEEILKAYEEPLEFYVMDRQPIEKFMRFAGKQMTEDDFPALVQFCQEMILDEEGNHVMTDGKVLPNMVMARCVTKVIEQLGK